MRREVNVALVFARSAAIMHLQSPRTVKHVSRGHAHAAVLHPAGSIVAAALLLIARAIRLVRVPWEVVWQVEEVLLAAVPLVIDDHADVILKLLRWFGNVPWFEFVEIRRRRGVVIRGILAGQVLQR